MDLAERLLPRVNSRLGLQRLQFSPYDQHQLREIMNFRLRSAGSDIFEDDAIEYISRKVTSLPFPPFFGLPNLVIFC